MKTFLILLSLLFLLIAFVIFTGSSGAIHEIEGIIMLLISMLCFCTAAVLDRLDSIRPKQQPSQNGIIDRALDKLAS